MKACRNSDGTLTERAEELPAQYRPKNAIILAAFPIAIVIALIIASFIKDAKRYIREGTEEKK